MEKKRILFVSQEIMPFLPKTEVSATSRRLPQGVQDSGKEIRVFSPKFGAINERRHQLHEVIRLSGMNLVIDDKDHPLIIKVASIPSARIQVYFIDNDEYFKRKNTITDEAGNLFQDNDERSIFFCRGVLETVKKLGWKPDVIHCNGWMASLMPLYIKKNYNKDPHFADTKVVINLYNNGFDTPWDPRFSDKLAFEGFTSEVTDGVIEPTYKNVMRTALKFADGLTVGSDELDEDSRVLFDEASCLKLAYVPEENQNKTFSEFFDRVIEEAVLV